MFTCAVSCQMESCGYRGAMKKNVLVFPCGSEIGLEIYASMKYSTYFHLIGLSSVDDHGKYVFEDYIGDAPMIDDDRLIPFLRDLVKERDIKAIYPAMDTVISVLKKNEQEIGCMVIAAGRETAEICMSKSKTYEFLKDTLRVPEIYENLSDLKYPVFGKPDVGYGARGTEVLYSEKQLLSYLEKRPDSLIMEYLPGDEYTVDCFTDSHGRLLFVKGRKRNRIRSGISVNTFFMEDQTEFQECAERINRKIKMKGAWFFQMKQAADGKLCLLEVAARFGGSSSLCMAIGVNLPLLTLFDYFGYDVSVQPNNYNVSVDRALDSKYQCAITYDTVYVDFDDCLILDGNRVNDELVAFLYRCINQKKQVILLSKHDGDLQKDLAEFRLDHLFDEVIHLPKTAEKWKWIETQTAIYIDDSFAERTAVQDHCGIAVFSPEMVQVL